jgi:signal transduction histidine kinase/DNA-binding response OmpR family regulator
MNEMISTTMHLEPQGDQTCPKRILIIDDETLIRRSLADYLEESGYITVTARDGSQGLDKARQEPFHVVLVDLRMPHVDGLKVVATLKTEQPELPVVVISGTGVLSDAVEAMRRGAWDYITKPIQDMDEIVVVIERVLDTARLRAERDRYQNELEQLNRSLEAEVARQTRDLRQHNRELMALNRVSQAISGVLDLDAMLDRAVSAAIAALDADGGDVRLLNPSTAKLVIAAIRGFPESYEQIAASIPLGQGFLGQVAQHGRPLSGSVDDLFNDPWLIPLKEISDFCSYLCVPLRTGDEILGTLGVAKRMPHQFPDREIELLMSIGNQIGVAIARAQHAADLKQANVELERANAELRRLDTLREQFIQNVAHELRTPLGLVRGYVEMLNQEDLSAEERKMAFGVVSRRVEALVELVQSITTLQDLDSQPLRMEKISPSDLVSTAIQMVGQRAGGANINICTHYPSDTDCFPGDFARLAQALHQLLDNACKFSPDRTTITVTVQQTQDAMLISVADQGIGIPFEEHHRIFDRFYQIDGSTTRRYGGTGLGLAVAKEIVEAHGGRISLQSAPNQGSVFTISLPLTGHVAFTPPSWKSFDLAHPAPLAIDETKSCGPNRNTGNKGPT